MTELTNKDGVPIRVGQVWRMLDDDNETEVIGVHRDIVWIRVGGSLRFEVGPDNPYTHRLTSDPIWGDMSDWRIVTDDERREYPIPDCAQRYISETSKSHWHRPIDAILGEGWANLDRMDHEVWRVPRDFVWPKDKPKEPWKELSCPVVLGSKFDMDIGTRVVPCTVIKMQDGRFNYFCDRLYSVGNADGWDSIEEMWFKLGHRGGALVVTTAKPQSFGGVYHCAECGKMNTVCGCGNHVVKRVDQIWKIEVSGLPSTEGKVLASSINKLTDAVNELLAMRHTHAPATIKEGE